MEKAIVWRQYRDETTRSLPLKLMDLVKAYKEKTGKIPTFLGLPPVLKGYALLDELEKRFEVAFVVPEWAGCEIWLGSPPVVPPNGDHIQGDGEVEYASI